MKKLLVFVCLMALCGLTACEFHSKQAKDDTYYKRTQSIDWPEQGK